MVKKTIITIFIGDWDESNSNIGSIGNGELTTFGWCALSNQEGNILCGIWLVWFMLVSYFDWQIVKLKNVNLLIMDSVVVSNTDDNLS